MRAPKANSFVLDTPRWWVSDADNPPSEGTHSGCDLRCGAGAVPARGLANRSRAALGPRSSGTMTGPRGARCTGAGEGPPVCTRRFQETRPGAESGVTAWREPRWSAERRARPAGRAATPEARAGGNICWRGEAPRDSCAFSALRLPSLLFGGSNSLGVRAENSDADASRERDRLSVIRHPEVAAKRPSKDTAEALGPSSQRNRVYPISYFKCPSRQ
jgi:hypothetical protein